MQIHHHYHHAQQPVPAPGLDQVLNSLRAIMGKLTNMAITLEDLTAKLQAENTTISAATALLDTIKSHLDEAIAANDPTRLQALSDLIDQGQSDLAAAIAKDTPAASADSAADQSAGAASSGDTTSV